MPGTLIGVEIVARRNEILQLLDFRWLCLPSSPFCARRWRGWPGKAGRSQEGCLAKQPTDCDLREKGDRRRRELETISLASPWHAGCDLNTSS